MKNLFQKLENISPRVKRFVSHGRADQGQKSVMDMFYGILHFAMMIICLNENVIQTLSFANTYLWLCSKLKNSIACFTCYICRDLKF